MRRRATSDPAQLKMLVMEKEINWKYQGIVAKILSIEKINADDPQIASFFDDGQEKEMTCQANIKENGFKSLAYYRVKIRGKGKEMRYKLEEISQEEYKKKKGIYVKYEDLTGE